MDIKIKEAIKPIEDLIKSLYASEVVFESITEIESLNNNTVYRVIGTYQSNKSDYSFDVEELVFVTLFTPNFYQLIR